MRVTIEHREEPTVFGRRAFYVDCTVLFSEAEKAVLNTRQLGKHHIEVGSDISQETGIEFFGHGAWVLHLVPRVALLVSLVLCVLVWRETIPSIWLYLTVLAMIVPFTYRKWAEWRTARSTKFRQLSLGYLVHNPKFSVWCADAFQAKQAETAIVLQLQDLKSRLVAVAPGLAEQQVYSLT